MKQSTTKDMSRAAAEALKLLSDASNKQLGVIADAALQATKLLASQAAEAQKVTTIKGQDDHDFLLTFSSEVKTKLDTISGDIKDLKDGTTARIESLETEKLNIRDSYPVLYKEEVEKRFDDQEGRIRINTGRITQIMTWGSAFLLILTVGEFLLKTFVK